MKGKRHPPKQRDDLALAVAMGSTITAWAKENKVPLRTANEWAGKPEFKAAVEAHRRAINDRALGVFVRFKVEAVGTLARLMRSAKSEQVQFQAARTINELGQETEDRQVLWDKVEELGKRLDGNQK